MACIFARLKKPQLRRKHEKYPTTINGIGSKYKGGKDKKNKSCPYNELNIYIFLLGFTFPWPFLSYSLVLPLLSFSLMVNNSIIMHIPILWTLFPYFLSYQNYFYENIHGKNS